ncbi:MAG: DUF3900 domain-containing protein [Bacillaceae bacterium]
MEFEINYLSFYVITVEGKGENMNKRYRHFQTIDYEEYANSSLKDFLDGELEKIAKRKVERHGKTENAPTKLGYFITEPGHELSSNPNYNLFQRVQTADSKEQFQRMNEAFAVTYTETAAVRGGVFLVAQAKLRKYFDDPFVFILKCDFEPKVASISNESTLIKNIEMAITTKNMKSIMYPYMEEEGLTNKGELKIHQASHARYFEDFLKFVAYEQSMPEIVKEHVYTMVKERMEETLPEEGEEKEQFEQAMEIWSASQKREIQEHFTTDEIVEAAAAIVEHAPQIELKFKADHISVRGLLSDFGDNVHIAKVNGRYVTIIESDTLLFERGFSPIEFLKPDEIEKVLERIQKKNSIHMYDEE